MKATRHTPREKPQRPRPVGRSESVPTPGIRNRWAVHDAAEIAASSSPVRSSPTKPSISTASDADICGGRRRWSR